MSRTRKAQIHRGRKRVTQVTSKVKSMLIIFFDIKDIAHKNSPWQSINYAYCCDILRRLCENVVKRRPELWRQKNWLLHHDNTQSHSYFFTREFLPKSNITVVPHPHYFSLFLRLKMKLNGRHFDTIEVMEADSQALLNILIEHDFEDAFRKW
jgi:hypothetical protein